VLHVIKDLNYYIIYIKRKEFLINILFSFFLSLIKFDNYVYMTSLIGFNDICSHGRIQEEVYPPPNFFIYFFIFNNKKANHKKNNKK